MKSYLVVCALLITAITACKKEHSGGGTDTPTNQLLDSSLLLARDYYLWNKQIPSSFSTSSYADPNEVMEGIRQYSMESGFSAPVDRWSFGSLKTEWDQVSSGVAGDIGIGIFFRTISDLRVTNVEPASAAGKAGVQRAWRITKINGNSQIDTSSASITRIVNAVFGSSPVSLSFTKPDGSTADMTLTPGSYTEQPIALDTVYNAGSKTIGYFVLNSFLGDVNNMKAAFANSFQDFTNAGVTDMIVDLRYNGGGYVALQEELANYLVPAARNGSVMYMETFNDDLAQYNDTVSFSKKSSLALNSIVFILSQNTASASEALINIMRAAMTDVKLVGPSNSHGKPVGFFNIPVGDWYVFPVSIRIVNANNEGNYFNGFAPDKSVADGLDKQWGDLDEDCLAMAYKYLTTGSFRSSLRQQENASDENIRAYNSMRSPKPSIMVEQKIPGR
ncbi:MAG: S41 family peptidase [Flavihumibacter sp.]